MRKPSGLFIGRPVYWAVAGLILAVLAGLGLNSFHVRAFVAFQLIVLALAVAAVVAVVALHRHGERVTREPLD